MSNPDTNPRDSLDTLPNPNGPESAGTDSAAGRGDDASKGEGNVEADRRYREGVKKTVASGDVEQLAEEASRALDGEEGEELRAAEEKGRQAQTKANPSNASKNGA
jgi:hypothetical protein